MRRIIIICKSNKSVRVFATACSTPLVFKNDLSSRNRANMKGNLYIICLYLCKGFFIKEFYYSCIELVKDSRTTYMVPVYILPIQLLITFIVCINNWLLLLIIRFLHLLLKYNTVIGYYLFVALIISRLLKTCHGIVLCNISVVESKHKYTKPLRKAGRYDWNSPIFKCMQKHYIGKHNTNPFNKGDLSPAIHIHRKTKQPNQTYFFSSKQFSSTFTSNPRELSWKT